MAGDCCNFPDTPLSKIRFWRACAGAFCVVLLLLVSLPGYAQLPGSKPKEFAPVIPDFDSLSADWWTGWPDAELKQRKQWLEELEKAWQKWSKTLPENEELATEIKSVNQRFEGIRKNWLQRIELQKRSVMPEVKFPSQPDVLAWASADAAIALGRQRLTGLQLEMTQTGDVLSQSLSRLRDEIIARRDRSDSKVNKIPGTVSLFVSQMSHLQLIEKQHMLNAQLTTWEDEIENAEAELDRMLLELQYSSGAAEDLQKAMGDLDKSINELALERSKVQSAMLDSSSSENSMERELEEMSLGVSFLEAQLKLRKKELLQAMNQVVHAEDPQLSVNKNFLTNIKGISDSISRELSLRQRQVVAWTSDDSKEMRQWWRRFEKVNSGLGRVEELSGDVQRYEVAQLELFQQYKGWWSTVRERARNWFGQMTKGWHNLANYQLFSIGQTPITLRNIADIILVVVGAALASRVMRWILHRMVTKNRASESSMYNLGRVLHYCIIAITFIIILSMIGLDTSKLAIIAGALSVGIGFGMQAIFSNFISGLILLFEQPLRVGDLVELESGVFGRIRDINVRSTRITTRDNVDILVPNSEFVTGRVTNHTLEDPVRRIHVVFGVAYGTDPDIVREAALAAAERVPITFTNWQRKTEVWMTGFGDSSLDFKLVVWINSNSVSSLGDLYALYNLELLREFNQREIEIPYPQRDLHVRSWDAALPEKRRAERNENKTDNTRDQAGDAHGDSTPDHG